MKVLAVLLTVAGLTITIAWYGFLEPPFLSYRGLPFEPTVAEIRAGEIIPLRVTRCSSAKEEEDYLIARRLIRLDPGPGEKIEPIILPGGGLVPISPGCIEEVSMANAIPKLVPPGMYFIQGHAKVDGQWRSSKVSWSSRPFRVLPNEPDPASNRAPQ